MWQPLGNTRLAVPRTGRSRFSDKLDRYTATGSLTWRMIRRTELRSTIPRYVLWRSNTVRYRYSLRQVA